MKKKEKIKLIIGGVGALLGIGIYILAQQNNGFADFYTKYIYNTFSMGFAWITNFFPFSVVELGSYIVIIICIIQLVRGVGKLLRKKLHMLEAIRSLVVHFIFCVGSLFFLFVLNCGVNYYCSSFSEREGLEKVKYTQEQLEQVCLDITHEINRLEETLQTSESGTVIVEEDVKEKAVLAMKNLGETYSSLKGYYPNPKPLLFSEILSYQQVSGVYSPFTVEANYNDDMPAYYKPLTICHELSHLRGFMQEEEANYIGFLACINSEEKEFQYSGYMVAYSYCMSELYAFDQDSYQEIRGQLCDTAQKDLYENNEFWKQYEGTISEVQSKVNDAYLKANAQELGTRSYNQVVELIVAQWKKK